MTTYFWKPNEKNGFLSNWSKHSFKENDLLFHTAENYLMYHKAKLMLDEETAAKILLEKNPANVKKLGRSIKNFNDKLWNEHKEEIMKNGLLLKVKQNPELIIALKDTENNIAENSPFDYIWGIGANGTGQNLLGRCWISVKKEII